MESSGLDGYWTGASGMNFLRFDGNDCFCLDGIGAAGVHHVLLRSARAFCHRPAGRSSFGVTSEEDW